MRTLEPTEDLMRNVRIGNNLNLEIISTILFDSTMDGLRTFVVPIEVLVCTFRQIGVLAHILLAIDSIRKDVDAGIFHGVRLLFNRYPCPIACKVLRAAGHDSHST